MLQDQNLKKLRSRWIKKTFDYCALSTVLCLTGCMGVYEGGFECPPGEGVGCKSISEVNQMVDQGSVPGIQCSEGKLVTSEIWYSPSFTNNEKEKKKARCLDATNSI